MILREAGQAINVVTRAIIIRENHLLVTKWKHGYSFLIGGRVEHGEDVLTSMQREVLEEVGTDVINYRFRYFCEHFFSTRDKRYHEFGWYFMVDLARHPCGLKDIIANPDHHDLEIRYIPLNRLKDYRFYPRFLVEHICADVGNEFCGPPKHIISRQSDDDWDVSVQSIDFK